MDTFSHVPPGFRFHPTDEELVDYYLRKKIASKRIDLDVIKDVDLYKIEPWDLQELCRIGTEEQSDWYFFSHKDKKYPTGTRTNRATKAGFWKATGRDKAIYTGNSLIGMRKTLVFYKGRAPNGQKSDWIMHEYRLETNENGSPGQEEGYVVCRVFKKRMPTIMRRVIGDYGSPICSSSTTNWYDDQASMFMSSELDSPHQITISSNQPNNYSSSNNNNSPYHLHQFSSSKQQILGFHHQNDPFLQLPQLESPKVNPNTNCNSLVPYGINTQEDQIQQCRQQQNLTSSTLFQTNNIDCDQVTDWRVLDKLVAYHLSHDDQDGSKEINNSSNFSTQALFAMADQEQRDVLAVDNEQKFRSDTATQYASTSATSTCQIDLWK